MDVSAAGTGSPILEPPVRLNEPGGTSPLAAAATGTTPGISDDTVGTHLQLLSTPQIHRLLSTIDAQRFTPDAAVLDGLLQTAGSAVAHHDTPRALAALIEYVNRNPEHASTLPASPALSPIQGDVKELVRHIKMDARTEAVRLIGTAGEVVDAAARHPQMLDGPGVLAVAERFVESGQLVNYIRAAELSQAVIAFYGGAAPGKLNSEKPVRRPLKELAFAMWRRVPLLVLLLGWLALGVAGGVTALLVRMAGGELNASAVQAGFELWGVGFLVLVMVQFFIRVTRFR